MLSLSGPKRVPGRSREVGGEELSPTQVQRRRKKGELRECRSGKKRIIVKKMEREKL